MSTIEAARRVTTIVVADDHSVVRKGLRFLLESHDGLEVVGEAQDGMEALRVVEETSPSIVVMDIAMPRLNGIDAASQILRRSPATNVILLSMHSAEEYLIRALNIGVRAYILKDSAEDDLIRAVRSAESGQSYFSPAIAQALAEEHMRQLRSRQLEDSYELLTERERHILQLLAEGRSNKDVAAVLRLSPYTVETHRTHIMRKLNLHSTAEIVLYAVRKKLVFG
ncbi:MAG: response regulator transcription factor [Acidobacteria bacterium]|nr:response regulator transcription factor [Acidobacteriota bacterium]